MTSDCSWPTCSRHPLANGYCLGHQMYASKPLPEKKPKGLNRVPAKKSAKELELDEKTALQKWFEHIMATEKNVCWETGEVINKADSKGWHGSIAHVLPKKTFKSVATHPMNYMILKMWGGTHARYDASWDSAQKMKVWPEAVRRFLIMWPDIADAERKYIPNCLLRELEKVEP